MILKILGAFLVSLPFVVIFVISGRLNGWKVTAYTYGVVAAVFVVVLVGLIFLGVDFTE